MKKLRLLNLLLFLALSSSISFGQTSHYVSNTGDDTNGDGTIGNPWASIKFAINNSTANDIIHIAAGTYTEVNIIVNKTLNFKGEHAGTTIIQAQEDKPDGSAAAANRRVITVSDNANPSFSQLTIRHGNIDGGAGGGILINQGSELTLENCNVSDCYTSGGGGAIGSWGNMNIIASSLSNNISGSSGGAIATWGSSQKVIARIENTVIYGNIAKGGGSNTGGAGAIFSDGGGFGGELYLNNNTIIDNLSELNNFNGIRVQSATNIMSLTNNILFNSSNNTSGGGIDVTVSSNALYPSEDNNKGNIYSFVWPALLNSNTIPANGTDPKPTRAMLQFGTFAQAVDGLWSLPITEGSIAIDMADVNSATSADIHGTSRGNTPDSGAFEYSTATNIEVEPLEVSIYPSPSNGTFTLNMANTNIANLEVFTMTGQKIHSQQINNYSTTITIPNKISGIVILRITGNGSEYIQKHLITR